MEIADSVSRTLYLLDTCALTEFEEFFDPESWGPVWEFLTELAKQGKLRIIEEVYLELEKRFPDNIITKWAKENRDFLYMPYKPEHFVYLQDEVLDKCNIIDEHKTNPVYADPLLLAVAGQENITLVTHENKKPGIHPNTKAALIRIPNHAEKLGIDCIYGPHVWKILLARENFKLKS